MTFQAGDKVQIEWPEPVFGIITGKTQEFMGETHWYVLCDAMGPGLLCHPDRLRLVEEEN